MRLRVAVEGSEDRRRRRFLANVGGSACSSRTNETNRRHIRSSAGLHRRGNPAMNVHRGIDGLRELPRGCVLSIGNFDGMHRGHLSIIERARELQFSRELAGHDAARGAIVTFEPHPLTVLKPEKAPPRLTPAALKRSLLEAVGVDDLIELPPSREILNLAAEEFFAIL